MGRYTVHDILNGNGTKSHKSNLCNQDYRLVYFSDSAEMKVFVLIVAALMLVSSTAGACESDGWVNCLFNNQNNS